MLTPSRRHMGKRGTVPVRAEMDWNKIIGVRSLILSGFYSDPGICSVILDRCLIAIWRDAIESFPEESPGSQDEHAGACPLAR